MKMRGVAVAIAAACGVTLPCWGQEAAPQAAGEGRFFQEGVIELTWDRAEDADVAAVTVEYAAAVRVWERLTVETNITLEPVGDAAGDAVLENEGAYVETLSLAYVGDVFTLFAGKINPAFGSAADLAPGLYGTEIGEAYEITERIGGGGDVDLAQLISPGVASEQVLSLAVFTADRTALSSSIGTERPRLHLADVGPGNTESLKSYSISLDGQFENGFGYTVGYRQLAAAQPGDVNERGVVAGVHGGGSVSRFEAEWLAEAVSIDGADGVDGARRTYWTAGATLRDGDWRASFVASGQDDNAVAGDADLDRLELMVGRDFDRGFTLDAGVQSSRENGDTSTMVGLRLSWAFGG